ncbi:MAG: F0F1 ATP synthase subunit epsilon [Parasporobacterium sp.]|nr:F0F1 ATP synthase subunit epsilon [Parasporobacterium sp.]
MSEFQLEFLAADRAFYVGACESLVVPLSDGALGILAGHANLMAAIVPGEVHMKIRDYEDYLPPKEVMDPKQIRNRTEGTVDVVVSNGLIKVENGNVTILVDSAELPHEIDEKRAKLAADRAKEEMLQNRGIIEYRSAEGALSRALARLNSRHRHF